jgi:hypothetical protein
LDDFVTNGHAYRINIDAATQKYFYLENHQYTNYWETHSPFSTHPDSIDGGIEEPGLYVVRQMGMGNTVNSSGKPEWSKYAKELVPANGRYTWNAVSSLLNPYGGDKIFPVWYKGAQNKTTGYSDLELVPHTYSYTDIQNPSAISFLRDTLTHANPEPDYFLGDGKDAFRIGQNQVFSPWSNPNNQMASGSTTKFGFELTSISSGICTLNLYVNTASAASSSIPQNLRVAADGSYHPVFTWDNNSENDISLYEVWRKIDDGSWTSIATTTTNSYTDNQVIIPPAHDKHFKYKVRAKDTQNYYSVYSDEVAVEGYKIYKISEDETGNEIPEALLLSQNSPNPFNPTTKIRFSIPSNGYVSLKVYDILGREVAVLANRVLEAGQYEYNFNGENLASGTYIYCLRTNNKTITKKMLMIK